MDATGKSIWEAADEVNRSITAFRAFAKADARKVYMSRIQDPSFMPKAPVSDPAVAVVQSLLNQVGGGGVGLV